ncbi:hypothetical protein [Niveispirillum irakense]|uniref:hypothetical protein n=1 Tax=Niveispirillum irakense TaxID=34011 RepID=UPI0003F6595A|nr:hypothetical protein [Niveispirillum irakense]
MDAHPSGSAPSPLSHRPRLTPGVPAGGVAAVLVALGVIVWGSIAGDPVGDTVSFKVDTDFSIPAPPAPPAPPEAPSINVDVEGIRRSVAEAMRQAEMNNDPDKLRMAEEKLAMAQQKLAAMEGMIPKAAQEALAAAKAQVQAERARIVSNSVAGVATQESEIVGDSYRQSFTAPGGVRLANIQGDVMIEVSSRAEKVQVNVDGGGGLRTSLTNGVLTISGRGDDGADVRLVVPESARMNIAGHAGDVTIAGRSEAPLDVQMRRGTLRADRTSGATVNIAESGSVYIERVDGPFRARIGGSADIRVDRTETADLEVMGRADISIGRINDATNIAVPGYADINIDRVNGPVRVKFGGAGNISIKDGRAEPLQATLNGAGSLDFGGVAVNPQVTAAGSGSVSIAKHEGTPSLNSSGSGGIHLGE